MGLRHPVTYDIFWTYECGLYVMGWLRLVGCLKIQVSLQNTGLFCRALLQKRPIFSSIPLIVATPYGTYVGHICGTHVYTEHKEHMLHTCIYRT